MPILAATEKRWNDQSDLVLSSPVLWEFNRKHFIIEVRGLETTELTCIYVTIGTLWGCGTIWKNSCSVSDLCACLKKTFETIDANNDEPVAAPGGWEVLED